MPSLSMHISNHGTGKCNTRQAQAAYSGSPRATAVDSNTPMLQQYKQPPMARHFGRHDSYSSRPSSLQVTCRSACGYQQPLRLLATAVGRNCGYCATQSNLPYSVHQWALPALGTATAILNDATPCHRIHAATDGQ
jgi:hypothetical protein